MLPVLPVGQSHAWLLGIVLGSRKFAPESHLVFFPHLTELFLNLLSLLVAVQMRKVSFYRENLVMLSGNLIAMARW